MFGINFTLNDKKIIIKKLKIIFETIVKKKSSEKI